jgi:hypothetical protein
MFPLVLLIIINRYRFWPNWPSSRIQVVVLKESTVMLISRDFLILLYAVTMHMFSLWFCWFVDFSSGSYVAILNVFVGAEALYLVAAPPPPQQKKIEKKN